MIQAATDRVTNILGNSATLVRSGPELLLVNPTYILSQETSPVVDQKTSPVVDGNGTIILSV